MVSKQDIIPDEVIILKIRQFKICLYKEIPSEVLATVFEIIPPETLYGESDENVIFKETYPRVDFALEEILRVVNFD